MLRACSLLKGVDLDIWVRQGCIFKVYFILACYVGETNAQFSEFNMYKWNNFHKFLPKYSYTVNVKINGNPLITNIAFPYISYFLILAIIKIKIVKLVGPIASVIVRF